MKGDVEEADVDVAAGRSRRAFISAATSASAVVIPVMKSMMDRPMRAGGVPVRRSDAGSRPRPA